MMTLADIEAKQSELLKKVQELFQNPDRTQREMDILYEEIRQFEKQKTRALQQEIFSEGLDN
jgi:hypothetical protein